MSSLAAQLIDCSAKGEPTMLVVVANAKGSVPREAGAWMIVSAERATGTIGGGHLELKSIEIARSMIARCVGDDAVSVRPERSEGFDAMVNPSNPSLRSGRTGVDSPLTLGHATVRQFPLGPALGQCCGGAVEIAFVPIADSDRAWLGELSEIERSGGTFTLRRALDTGAELALPLTFNPWHVWVFGAGHVGKAIVDVLGALPCAVTWVDSRDAQFPATVPANAAIIETDSPADEVRHIPSGADVLVLTHSHALDLEICAALIARDDLAYIGVIGSETKATTFRKRFEQRGRSGTEIARMICPIGLAALNSKHPGVIAVGVAADLIERRQLYGVNDRQAVVKGQI
ncbi:MAG: xanthine dehydrogenase accessory protein XdhC [Casimicrobium sp.]